MSWWKFAVGLLVGAGAVLAICVRWALKNLNGPIS